jgi:hypothetical protein
MARGVLKARRPPPRPKATVRVHEDDDLYALRRLQRRNKASTSDAAGIQLGGWSDTALVHISLSRQSGGNNSNIVIQFNSLF